MRRNRGDLRRKEQDLLPKTELDEEPMTEQESAIQHKNTGEAEPNRETYVTRSGHASRPPERYGW